MSYKRSVFPEGGYDTFVELYDLPPSYEPLVLEFAELRANQNRTPEEEIRFNELTVVLQNYILDPEKWNKFCDAVTGLQKFFLENTQGYIDDLKAETRQTVDDGKAEINTTKDNALIAIENKKENIIDYMDGTTAGQIRNDIGVMADSTIEGRSLVDKTNNLKEQVDTNTQNISENSNKISILSGTSGTKEKANKEDLDAHKAESVTHKVSNRKPTATDDETQNIKQGDIWIYENYINEEEYEFIAYQCMDNKAGMAKWKKYVEKVAVPQKIYGVEIDENNSNPETAVVYTDDAVGFTPARGNNGNFDWGSWESIIKEEFQIRPCVLRNLGGGNAEVNYYLDYDDYTKRADGSNSRLDGVDGDVMIEFGVPLWWKFSRVGSKLKIQLSNREFEGAVKYAFEIEDGYNQMPIYPLFLTQIIYLLMFKHLDSQTALGRGYVDENTDFLNTGTSNNRPFMFGETTGKQQMKFLGIEDYWGNRRWRIDGCFYDNRNMLIGKGNFNDKGNGYTNYGQATPSDGGGYIDKIQGQNETGFIPASISGSATTFYCDYGYVYAGRLPYFGGHRSNGDIAGAFYLDSNTAAYSNANIGGRLFYSKDSKIYIGAYLGVNQGGKLRSISGYESHNNATIGEFRTLARANN